ncbi:MAG: GIY-YIG nuclease family protein [Methanosarcinaceae archaeon]|nr:GIY-YIG nuclease family protein [Methanosarcinaceae archaeon]
MSIKEKYIEVELMDGTPTGRFRCKIKNRNIVVLKIPRVDIDKSKDIKELSYSGIYFLLGKSDENNENSIYIGQAVNRKNGEGILYRLNEHKKDYKKDFWTEAIIVTSPNNSLGLTELSFLENKYYNIAIESKRYDVTNLNAPNPGNFSPSVENQLLEYIDYSMLIIGVLGYKVFTPLVKSESVGQIDQFSESYDKSLLYINKKGRITKKEYEARGKMTSEGFVVLEGSQIDLHPAKNFQNLKSAKTKRENAKMEDNILRENILFNTPSGAAEFVIGSSANGWDEWKDKAGKKLKEIEDIKITNSKENTSQLTNNKSDNIDEITFSVNEPENKDELVLYIKGTGRKSRKEYMATCKKKGNAFLVLKNSQIDLDTTDSLSSKIIKKRNEVKISENGVLMEDVEFTSASTSAKFVIGSNVNGKDYWKDKTGRTLNEIERSKK